MTNSVISADLGRGHADEGVVIAAVGVEVPIAEVNDVRAHLPSHPPHHVHKLNGSRHHTSFRPKTATVHVITC